MLERSFSVPDRAVAGARAYLASTVTSGTRTAVRLNRVTAGSRQLRIGRDGRWYPYAKAADGTFQPAGGPIDPADLADSADLAAQSPKR